MLVWVFFSRLQLFQDVHPFVPFFVIKDFLKFGINIHCTQRWTDLNVRKNSQILCTAELNKCARPHFKMLCLFKCFKAKILKLLSITSSLNLLILICHHWTMWQSFVQLECKMVILQSTWLTVLTTFPWIYPLCIWNIISLHLSFFSTLDSFVLFPLPHVKSAWPVWIPGETSYCQNQKYTLYA